MQLKTYPLNNIDYSAEDAELFHCTRTSGVYGMEDFTTSIDATNNKVIVSDGIGWIRNGRFSGKVIALKESSSLEFDIPDPVYDRIDAIVLQFDAAANETNLIVKKGVAASSPSAPEVIRTESVYELHLYHVMRNAGALPISESDILDKRPDSDFCGIMIDSVSHGIFDQAVMYVKQDKSEDEQAQARENIGAVSKDDIKTVEWTPTINKGTITANYCTYCKVNNMCTITFQIDGIGNATDSTGSDYELKITGLPSNIAAKPNGRWYCGGGHEQGLKTKVNYAFTGFALTPGDMAIRGRAASIDGTSTSGYCYVGNGGAAFYLSGSISYPVAE